MDATFLQYGKQPGLVGDKFSGSGSTFGGCPRQKKNLSVLVRILNESDDGERISTECTPSGWDVFRPFI